MDQKLSSMSQEPLQFQNEERKNTQNISLIYKSKH